MANRTLTEAVLFDEFLKNKGTCWNLLNNPKSITSRTNVITKSWMYNQHRIALVKLPQKSSADPNDSELPENKLKEA